MSSSTPAQIPTPSALSTFLSTQSASTHPPPATALPREILHNLRHQHSWSHLRFHPANTSLSAASPAEPPNPSSPLDPVSPPTPIPLLSGTPPKPLYTHPDLQLKFLQAGIAESQLLPEHEWVLPSSLGRKWTLRELCAVFDALPVREVRVVRKGSRAEVQRREGVGTGGGPGDEDAKGVVRHQDAKRVLLAIKAHDGRGGDGTVVYYIVQEGEVKPRQN